MKIKSVKKTTQEQIKKAEQQTQREINSPLRSDDPFTSSNPFSSVSNLFFSGKQTSNI